MIKQNIKDSILAGALVAMSIASVILAINVMTPVDPNLVCTEYKTVKKKKYVFDGKEYVESTGKCVKWETANE